MWHKGWKFDKRIHIWTSNTNMISRIKREGNITNASLLVQFEEIMVLDKWSSFTLHVTLTSVKFKRR